MLINYLIPSWNRAQTITTLGYITRACALVAERQYDEYVKYNPMCKDRIIAVPNEVQGYGKSKCLNWMLDNCWSGYDAIVHLDDDIKTYMRHHKAIRDDGSYCEYEPITEDDFYEIAENACSLAYEWGCGMWGLSVSHDPLAYSEFMPFRTLGYIDGGTVGYVMDDGIRYDEELTVKEDVDYFLQSIQKYHKALRIEKYHVEKGSFTNKGGNQDFRTPNLEKEQFQKMQLKWGSNVIRPNMPVAKNKSKIRGFGGAIRLNLPYEGV